MSRRYRRNYDSSKNDGYMPIDTLLPSTVMVVMAAIAPAGEL